MEPPDAFAIIGIVIVIGFFAEWVFRKTNIPDILALMFLGLMIGPIFRLSNPSDMAGFAPIFAPIALMVLLFDGGLHMNIYKVLYDTPKAGLYALTNILFSIFLGAVVMNIIFGWSFYMGAILGAIVGGTSSAIVLPILGKLNIYEEASDILSLESAVTDVLCIVATITILNMVTRILNPEIEVLNTNPANVIVGTFAIGILLGSIAGLIWLRILHRFKGLSYMLTLSVIFILYAMSEWIGGSGAIAALIFGIILGNRDDFSKLFRIGATASIDRTKMELMQTEISFFVKTFFFVYLGMIVSVSDVRVIIIGVIFSLLLIGARYFSTWLISRRSELEKHIAFMAAMGPRGLAAAVLAQMPQVKELDSEGIIGDLAFVVIISTVVLSSLGVIYLSKKNGNDEAQPEQGDRLETTSKLKKILK
ncbi:MAG: cation:proton antiporter, partial [Candidatus Micrarchaeota archaeon]